MSSDKILLIGSKGALGQQLVKIFANDHLVNWSRDEVDITNAAAVRQGISVLRPTIIINASAYNDVDGAETNPTMAMAVNATAVGVMAQVAREAGAKFITYSTDYVFAGDQAGGYTEDARPHPVNQYGASKLRGEQLAQSAGGEILIIRVSRLFGPMATSIHGKENFPDKMLQLARNRSRLEAISDIISTPTYTVDVAQATRALLADKVPPGIYHLVNEGAGSWYDLAQETFRIMKVAVELVPVPAATFPSLARRPDNATLLNTKRPKLRHWQAALKEYLSN